MNAIKWTEEMSVGIEEIDEQHKYFVEIMNELYGSLIKKENEGALDVIIKKLIRYAKIHFETEERYFEEFNYENAVEHKEMHTNLLTQLEEFNKEHQEFKKIDLSFKLLDFLENWLVDHLENEDKQYVECFKMNGLK